MLCCDSHSCIKRLEFVMDINRCKWILNFKELEPYIMLMVDCTQGPCPVFVLSNKEKSPFLYQDKESYSYKKHVFTLVCLN